VRRGAALAPGILALVIALGAGPAPASGGVVAPRGTSALPALSTVDALVAAGLQVNVVTPAVASQLSGNAYAWIPDSQCLTNAIDSSNATPCVLGDTAATTTVVLLGDSSADEWALDLGSLASTAGFRLVVYVHSACPVGAVDVALYGEHPDPSCPVFRSLVLADLAGMQPAPALVLVSELRLSNYVVAGGGRLSNASWSKGLTRTLDQIEADGIPVALLHGVPVTPLDPAACIAANPNDVANCGVQRKSADPGGYNQATWAGAHAAHAAGVSVTPLFCTSVACPIVVSDDVTHSGVNHVAERYAATLTDALGELVGCAGTQTFAHHARAARVLKRLLGGATSVSATRACRALAR